MAQGINNAGSMMAAAGNDYKQTFALLTAANATVQDISKASTGLRTIAARIRNTTTELNDLGEAMTSVQYGELVKALTDAKVELTDANGEFRSTYDILRDLASVWDELGSVQQAAIAKTIAGTRQQNVLASILTQFKEAENAMQSMETDAIGDLQEAYNIFLESVTGHLDQLKAAWTEFATSTITTDFVNSIIDFGKEAIKWLSAVMQFIKELGGLKTILSIIAPLLVSTFSTKIINLVVRMGSSISNLGSYFSRLQNNITGFTSSQNAANTAMRTGATVANTLSGAIQAICVAAAAAKLVTDIISKIISLFQKPETNVTILKVDEINEANDSLVSLYKRYAELSEQTSLTEEDQESFNDVTLQLAESLGIEVEALRNAKDAASDYSQGIADAVKSQQDLLVLDASRNIEKANEALVNNAHSRDTILGQHNYDILNFANLGTRYYSETLGETAYGTVLQSYFDIVRDGNEDFEKQVELLEEAGFRIEDIGKNARIWLPAINDAWNYEEILSYYDSLLKIQDTISTTKDSDFHKDIDNEISYFKTWIEQRNEAMEAQKNIMASEAFVDVLSQGYDLSNLDAFRTAVINDANEIVESNSNLTLSTTEVVSAVDNLLQQLPEFSDFYNGVTEEVEQIQEPLSELEEFLQRFNLNDISDALSVFNNEDLSSWTDSYKEQVETLKTALKDGVDDIDKFASTLLNPEGFLASFAKKNNLNLTTLVNRIIGGGDSAKSVIRQLLEAASSELETVFTDSENGIVNMMTNSNDKTLLLNYLDELLDSAIIEIESKESSFNSAFKSLLDFSDGGTVDLTVRPNVDTSLLQKAGYNVQDGDFTRAFAESFSNDDNTVAINLSPVILDEYGNVKGVLSKKELKKYAKRVLDGGDDYLKLQIGAKFDGDDALNQAQDTLAKIQDSAEEFYIDFNGDQYKELIEGLSDLGGFSNAATEELQKLNEALEGGDYDDGMEARVKYFEQMQELLENGKVGTKEYKAIADYFGIGDLDLAEQYNWMKLYSAWFSDAADGTFNFLDYIESVNDELGELISYDVSTGEFWFNPQELDTIAEKLGITKGTLVDLINSVRSYTADWEMFDSDQLNEWFKSADLIKESGNGYIIYADKIREIASALGFTEDEIDHMIEKLYELDDYTSQNTVEFSMPEFTGTEDYWTVRESLKGLMVDMENAGIAAQDQAALIVEALEGVDPEIVAEIVPKISNDEVREEVEKIVGENEITAEISAEETVEDTVTSIYNMVVDLQDNGDVDLTFTASGLSDIDDLLQEVTGLIGDYGTVSATQKPQTAFLGKYAEYIDTDESSGTEYQIDIKLSPEIVNEEEVLRVVDEFVKKLSEKYGDVGELTVNDEQPKTAFKELEANYTTISSDINGKKITVSVNDKDVEDASDDLGGMSSAIVQLDGHEPIEIQFEKSTLTEPQQLLDKIVTTLEEEYGINITDGEAQEILDELIEKILNPEEKPVSADTEPGEEKVSGFVSNIESETANVPTNLEDPDVEGFIQGLEDELSSDENTLTIPYKLTPVGDQGAIEAAEEFETKGDAYGGEAIYNEEAPPAVEYEAVITNADEIASDIEDAIEGADRDVEYTFPDSDSTDGFKNGLSDIADEAGKASKSTDEATESTDNFVRAVGSNGINTVEKYSQSLKDASDQDIKSDNKTSGINDVSSASRNAQNELQQVRSRTDEVSKTAINSSNKISPLSNISSFASRTIDTIRNLINTIRDFNNTPIQNKTATVTTVNRNVNASTAATGTKNAKGGLTLLGDEFSADGSPKPELVVSDGEAYIAGVNGPTFANLKSGDVVYPYDETKKILKNSVSNKIPAFAGGTVYRPHKNSSSGSSSGSSGTSSSSSDVSSEVENTNKLIDWIEVAIDRIERKISSLKSVAESTYKSLNTRLKATSAEISEITNEINVQKQAYTRYMQEASKVGLSEDLARLVRNGTIDIREYDENTQELISDYQTWYEKALDCASSIQELHEQLSSLYEDNFENKQQNFENQIDVLSHKTSEYTNSLDALGTKVNSVLPKLYEEFSSLSSTFGSIMNSDSGIEVGSEAWYSMQQSILDNKDKILETFKEVFEDVEKAYDNGIEELNRRTGSNVNTNASITTRQTEGIKKLIEEYQALQYTENQLVGNKLSISSWLDFGDTNEDVAKLQKSLRQLGYYCGDLDGIFGSVTDSAVRAFQKANGLTVDGIIGTETLNKINDLLPKIEEGSEAWAEMEDVIANKRQAIIDYTKETFDLIKTNADNQQELLAHLSNAYNTALDDIQEKGYLASTSYYKAMKSVEQSTNQSLQKELVNLKKSFKDAMDTGLISEYSEDWYEFVHAINDVEEALAKSNSTLIELDNNIRNLDWSYFDYALERISAITTETDFLVDLLSNSKLFSDTGQFTNEGMATLGLYAENYDVYMAQADEYAKELQSINNQLANDPANTKLIERREELLKLQQQSITAAESEKQSIKSLVEEGIKTELESLKSLIDTYKENLQNAKSLYEYNKKISDQTKNVAKLEKQIAAYQNDGSEETRATVQKLKVQLEEARENLEETEYDKYVQDQEKMLDSLYDDYSELLNSRLDDVNALMSDMIRVVNDNSKDIGDTLRDISSQVGYVMTNNVFNGGTAVSDYNRNFLDNQTTTNNLVKYIANYVAAMVRNSNNIASTDISGVTKFASGGLAKFTGLAHLDGSASKPELVLNPSDTQAFLALRDTLRDISSPMSVLKGSSLPGFIGGGSGMIGSVVNSVGDINIMIDHVEDYDDFVRQLQKDPGFERLVQSMTTDRIAGKSSLGKHSIKF